MAEEKKQGGGASGFFKNLAPYLGTVAQLVVPGPAGNLAASILNRISGKDVKPSDIGQAIQDMSLTEAGRLQLDQAEKEYSKACIQMGFDHEDKLLELEVADRKSARDREVSVKDNTPKILAYVLVSAFIFTVMLVLTGHAKAESVLAGTLIGYVSAKAEQVVAFYFGSSHGSERKTELLAKADAVKEG